MLISGRALRLKEDDKCTTFTFCISMIRFLNSLVCGPNWMDLLLSPLMTRRPLG